MLLRPGVPHLLAATCLFALLLPVEVAAEKEGPVWTDPATALAEDPDFSVQGEYGSTEPDAALGAQVVALGKGEFDVYLLEGGLPGIGWTRGRERQVVKAETTSTGVRGKSKGGNVEVFIADGKIKVTREGKQTTLPRVERSSPTLGAAPPEGAIVLFDGTSAEAWENGKVVDGLLAATNCMSKQHFGDHVAHIEFRTPYKPEARGQRRGNSGIYYGGRWETQILDSFGLEGLGNQTGGIYSIAAPKLNMCLPPLTWQTYDIEFKAARFDRDGRRIAWPRITVRLNGVLIHENLELAKDYTTAAPIKEKLTEPEGPMFLQDHGNPVFFRNIWVLPK